MTASCNITHCGKPVHGRGWCDTHYRRWLKHGDPLHVENAERGAARLYLHGVVLPYDGDECLIWPFTRNAQGYGKFNHEVSQLVHRVVCVIAHGEPPTPDHQAAHSCGKGHEGCVTKRHLSWKTPLENMADVIAHGNTTRGERQPNSKITEHNARCILKLKGLMLQREIADLFGISPSTVSLIHSRKLWGWLS